MLLLLVSAVLFTASPATAFQVSPFALRSSHGLASPSSLHLFGGTGGMGGMGDMKQSAEMLKNLSPAEMEKMLKELDDMPAEQVEQLKKMGMDPTMMKQSLRIMKENPAMLESAQKMMANMTPEQMMEQSKLAQSRMAQLTPEQLEFAAKASQGLTPEQLDAAATAISKTGSSEDPLVIEAMYRVAECMSEPAKGGVTFQGFATLPPIAVLSGKEEEDLNEDEFLQCWESVAQGKARVDRAGFEKVWKEVQEFFEDDIMGEARKTAKKRIAAPAAEEPEEEVAAAEPLPVPPTAPTVGGAMSPEQIQAMNNRAQNLSDQDMETMLEQMTNMTPEAEARMKAMGVDPKMMQQSAKMMKSNPLMKGALKTMMKNMTPAQMMQASQKAQQQLANMSEEDLKKAKEDLNKMS